MNTRRHRHTELIEFSRCEVCGEPVDLHVVMETFQSKFCLPCHRKIQALRTAL